MQNIQKNIKNSYKNNKFKIFASKWNNKFDRSFSISDIQDYFEKVVNIHEPVTDNSPIRICANKIENGKQGSILNC